MKNTLGEWKAKVERTKNGYNQKSVTYMNLSQFIDVYKTEELYLVDELDPFHPIADYAYIPKPLLCKGYLEHLLSVNMWFSSGNTKPVLHNDGYENVNCVFDGRKNLVLFDKKHDVPLVTLDNNSPFAPKLGYSLVNPEKVDLYKYPALSTMPWYSASVNEGDCFYLPSFWFHYVHSTGSRSLAINIWWRPTTELYHREECEKSVESLPMYEPLKKHPMNDDMKLEQAVLHYGFLEKNETTDKSFYKAILS
uniref:JmjC domain-containing protein n=1 Tax=Ciona savignyi TaxID=51511 RepID=H2ZN09_CIOSA